MKFILFRYQWINSSHKRFGKRNWSYLVSFYFRISAYVLTDISDHFAIFVRLNDLDREMPDNHLTYSHNDLAVLDDGSFYNKLYYNIDDVNLNEVSIDESLSILVHLFKSTIVEVCLQRLCTRAPGKPVHKPWMTNQLKLVFQKENRLYSKYCRSPVPNGDQYRLIPFTLNNL